eukprot:6967138-Pyramimonas_sp.AAC.1
MHVPSADGSGFPKFVNKKKTKAVQAAVCGGKGPRQSRSRSEASGAARARGPAGNPMFPRGSSTKDFDGPPSIQRTIPWKAKLGRVRDGRPIEPPFRRGAG